jgi:transcriptional/translational regulatory protein YebC/TACO1
MLTRWYSEAITDNRARTAARIKSLASSLGGALTRVLYQFEKKGVIVLDYGSQHVNDVLLRVIDAGAEDVQECGDSFKVVGTCSVPDF